MIAAADAAATTTETNCERFVPRFLNSNNDIIKIDQQVSEQLGIPIDTDRVARADGKTDARKD